MAESGFTALTHHFFEILGFSFLLLLGLESLLKHIRPVIQAAHVVYLDVQKWKGTKKLNS